MSKLKLFIENFLVYGLGGIISKIIPLIMVPIVTRLMPNSEYFGVSDMSNTIMTFAMYFALLGMYDAMYRMFFEKEDGNYKKIVCSTTFIFNLMSSFVVCVLMIVFREPLASFFLNNRGYSYIIYITALATFVGSTNAIIAAPTRMQNKRKVFLITNTLGPVLAYSVSIPLLLKGYYLIALPLAGLLSTLTIEVAFWAMNRKWFRFSFFDDSVLKELLRIGIPLLPNFLIYWVFNSCDKVMITKLMGIGEAGVYSVGAKLGLASQLIYTAFAGGWQYFAFSTMKDKDQVESNSKVFEYLGVISFVSTAFICALAQPIYILLFEGEYEKSFIVSPYLFLAPLIQMLYQVACNQFLVIKKTWPTMLILSSGAVINVIINLVLIPIMGIEGASIATLCGYVIATIICAVVLQKMRLLIISVRFMMATVSMGGFIVFWRIILIGKHALAILCAVVYALIMLRIYKNDIIALFKMRKQL